MTEPKTLPTVASPAWKVSHDPPGQWGIEARALAAAATATNLDRSLPPPGYREESDYPEAFRKSEAYPKALIRQWRTYDRTHPSTAKEAATAPAFAEVASPSPT